MLLLALFASASSVRLSAMVAAVLSLGTWYAEVQIRSLRGVADGERRSMSQVDVVREFLPSVSSCEGWSPTQRRQMQARVERFPV